MLMLYNSINVISYLHQLHTLTYVQNKIKKITNEFDLEMIMLIDMTGKNIQ